MTLGALVQRQGRAIVLITAIVAAAGLLSGWSLPSDIYPPLVFPRLVVIARSGTTPARTMMLTITRPLEQALMEVPGVRRVRSTTFRGATEISAQFDPSTDMVVALQQAQGLIAEVRTSLPADLDLVAERLTPAAFPFLSLNVTGALAPADLHDYAFYTIRPALARVAGVGRVGVEASDTREIEVVTDPARMVAAGLTIGALSDALKGTNELAPVGRFAMEGQQHLVLASGQWSSIDDIGRTPLALNNGATIIRLSDLAGVVAGAPDRTLLVTGDGRPAALVSVSQQIGANILDVRAGIETALADIARALPSGLKLSKTYDLAEFVATAIANVRDAIIVGGLLAVLVLLAFLRNWRLTLVAAATLPLTVLATFLLMRFLGASINVMSMGGLAVAIGLVIDDAVVVVENIHRHAMAADDPEAAVFEATSELVAPVVGSTLTTVVVFVPLGLLSGVVGQFFRALSLTLSAAVLISLALALTLTPLMARSAVRRARARGDEPARARPFAALDAFYSRTLTPTLGRVLPASIAAAILIIGAILTFRFVATGFLPHIDEGGFVIDYLTPPGSALEESDRQLKPVESILRNTPDIAAFARRTGAELGLFATQQNKGDILVRLKPAGQRRSSDEIINDLREKLEAAAPQMEIEFIQLLQDMLGDLEGTPTPIEVKIFGDDPDVLASLADRVQDTLGKVRGVVDIVGVQRGNPETTWNIDAAAAGRLGLSIAQASGQLSDAWLGKVATDLRLADRTIPVRVRYPDGYRLDPAQMAQTPIRGAEGRSAPISAVARSVSVNGQMALRRENLRQMAIVTGRLENRDLGSAVTEIQGFLRSMRFPIGYTTEVGGQYASQRQSFRELLIVFGIAIALVFIILVIQFRGFTPALLIIGAAPLSLGGAFALLILTGTELNVSSAMGIILLIGLVVKNGIVLLDYAHRIHAEGKPMREALAIAGQIRLRPILMTTLCTLFGLLPLALGIGAGAELQRPLALAVIGGLSLSTIVTLYLVPAVYAAVRPRV